MRSRGVSLIELMVTLVIGLVLSLAIFSVLSASQGRQRTAAAANDLDQAAHVALYTLDRWIRNAGSGFIQVADHALGCELYVPRMDDKTKAVAPALPRAAGSLPAPFSPIDKTPPAGTEGLFRLAPLIIVPNGSTAIDSGKSSDALILMSGASGIAETSVPFSKTVFSTDDSLALANTLQFRGDDLLLLTDARNTASAGGRCLVEQVKTGFVGGATTTLPLAGKFYAANLAVDKTRSFGLQDISGRTGRASNLGNVAEGAVRNVPNFLLIGVGARNTLYSYDLMSLASFESMQQSVAVADSVFEMHALYGIDSNGDGKVDRWAKPDSADYKPSVLLAGTSAARDALRTIRAVRIGLILKSSLIEKDAASDKAAFVAPPQVLFADLGKELTYTRGDLTAVQQRFRYRTVESTIPLRNVMVAP